MPMNTYKYRFSARLSKEQLDHVKAQAKPSSYLRELIELDLSQAENHERT
jgi:hypothetical protein